MADITMCQAIADDGRVCQIAHECWRHMAPANVQQWYGPVGREFDPKTGCERFYPMEKPNGTSG